MISNNSQSGALARARSSGIPVYHLSSWTHPDPDRLDREITRALQKHGVNLVVLAGYMKKLGMSLLDEFHNRVINIHPALLPAFAGKGMYGIHIHQSVLESGAKFSGVTVHLANDEYDQGPIVAQELIRVEPDDTPETLAKRVLGMEHRLYPSVIRWFTEDRVRVDGERVRLLDESALS